MLSDSGGWELTVSVSGVTCPRSYFPVLGGKQVFCWYFAVATLRAAHRELTVRAYIRDEVMSLRNWLYRLHPEAGFPPVSKMAASKMAAEEQADSQGTCAHGNYQPP